MISPRSKFLVWLEHQAHSAGQVVLHRLQQPRRAQQHGGVAVMTAGVHTALMPRPRSEWQACRLLDWQRVHVST
jgi:hypothetical protein